MKRISGIIPEIPDWYHQDTYAKVFSNLKRGENVQLVALKGFGKSILLRNLETNQEKIKQLNKVTTDMSFYLCDLNLLSDGNPNTIIRHIFRDIVGPDKMKSLTMEEILFEVSSFFRKLRQDGKVAIIILDSMEKLEDQNNKEVFDFLNGIYSENIGFLRFIFAFESEVDVQKGIKIYGPLGRLIMSKPVFVRNLDDRESYWFLNSLGVQIQGHKISDRTKDEIIKVSGGYMFAIKRIFEAALAGLKINEILVNPTIIPGLTYNIELILASLTDQQENIKKLINNNTNGKEDLTPLINLFFLTDRRTFISPIIESYLKKKYGVNEDKYFDVIGGVNLGVKLTHTEYKVIEYLYKINGYIGSREEIIEKVWGDKSKKGISNHAFDQMINRLRKKLSESGKAKIETIYKRGHRFILG